MRVETEVADIVLGSGHSFQSRVELGSEDQKKYHNRVDNEGVPIKKWLFFSTYLLRPNINLARPKTMQEITREANRRYDKKRIEYHGYAPLPPAARCLSFPHIIDCREGPLWGDSGRSAIGAAANASVVSSRSSP